MFENQPQMPQQQMPEAQPPAPQQDFHTMPERFLDTGGAPGGGEAGGAPRGSGSTGKKILIAAVSAVVLGGLGAGAWYYFTKMSNKNEANENAVVNVNANTNSIYNLNANTNTNLNENLNANTNINLNLNTNLNLNENLNLNTNLNANTNANTNTSITTGTPLPVSTDTDTDGLTDIEEQVFGTNANTQDSDSDGFIDGMRLLANGKYEGEAYNGYCPTKAGSVRLDDPTCSVVRTYTNTSFGYALWVPKNWLTQATSTDEKMVIVTPDSATSEFFQVNVLDNPSQLTAKNYYLSLNPGVDPTKIVDVTMSGLDGVISLDESTVYFVKGTKIYIISYNTDALTKVNFKLMFMIMYRSFHLTAASTTNTNINSSIVTNTNQ